LLSYWAEYREAQSKLRPSPQENSVLNYWILTDPVEEERQARRAEERAQRDQQPVAPVLNRGRRRRRTKYNLIPAHAPQNLEDAILDLHRCQLAEQLLRTTQEQRRVEGKRQRQVEINQIMEE